MSRSLTLGHARGVEAARPAAARAHGRPPARGRSRDRARRSACAACGSSPAHSEQWHAHVRGRRLKSCLRRNRLTGRGDTARRGGAARAGAAARIGRLAGRRGRPSAAHGGLRAAAPGGAPDRGRRGGGALGLRARTPGAGCCARSTTCTGRSTAARRWPARSAGGCGRCTATSREFGPTASATTRSSPSAYAWVHATLASAILDGHRVLGDRMRARRGGGLLAGVAAARAAGRASAIATSRSGGGTSAPTSSRVVEHELRDTETVHVVFETLARPIPPPRTVAARRLSGARAAPRRPPHAAHHGGPAAAGAARAVRARVDRRARPRVRLLAATSRASGPLVVGPLREFGPYYLRWRRAALERGEVASVGRHAGRLGPGATADTVKGSTGVPPRALNWELTTSSRRPAIATVVGKRKRGLVIWSGSARKASSATT